MTVNTCTPAHDSLSMAWSSRVSVWFSCLLKQQYSCNSEPVCWKHTCYAIQFEFNAHLFFLAIFLSSCFPWSLSPLIIVRSMPFLHPSKLCTIIFSSSSGSYRQLRRFRCFTYASCDSVIFSFCVVRPCLVLPHQTICKFWINFDS